MSGRRKVEEPPRKPDCSKLQPLSQEVIKYFEGRGISMATLIANKILQEHSGRHNATAIAFPYYRDGEIVNVKYRTLDPKKFWQASIESLYFLMGCLSMLAASLDKE
jgi:twinkle protein